MTGAQARTIAVALQLKFVTDPERAADADTLASTAQAVCHGEGWRQDNGHDLVKRLLDQGCAVAGRVRSGNAHQPADHLADAVSASWSRPQYGETGIISGTRSRSSPPLCQSRSHPLAVRCISGHSAPDL